MTKGINIKMLKIKFSIIAAIISLKTKCFLALCIATVPFSVSHSSIGQGMKQHEIMWITQSIQDNFWNTRGLVWSFKAKCKTNWTAKMQRKHYFLLFWLFHPLWSGRLGQNPNQKSVMGAALTSHMLIHNEIKCVLSSKESNFNAKQFSYSWLQ